MEKKNIVNFITFARGKNQAHPLDYMVEATREQVELFKAHNFTSTVLLMYDAFIEPEFYNYLKPQVENGFTEVGLWFEIPAQLVEKAGLKWRGREGFTWDWFNEVGFLVGYTLEERKLLIDTAMESFKEIFGYYPKVVGSWHIDTFSLNYLSEKYGIIGSCMCRDQWGTDGYTIWGGYEPIYYPSKNNVLCPASTEEKRINVPMLRMLGADPIYQFDIPYMRDKWNYKEPIVGQITLEPTILSTGKKTAYSGMDKNWSDWYFNMMVTDNAPFSYAQTGQENGFGWFRIEQGIKQQCDLLDKHTADGSIVVEKMSETCKWFADNYKTTPCVTVDVKKDWMEQGRKAVWYYSNYYRSSVLFEDNHAWIRELRLFDENYKEPHLETPCRTNATYYDNLPLVDGTLWSTKAEANDGIEQQGFAISEKESRAGLYPVANCGGEWKKVFVNDISTLTEGENSTVTLNMQEGCIKVEYEKRKMTVKLPKTIALQLVHNNNNDIKEIKTKEIFYCHNGYEYSLKLKKGNISDCGDGSAIITADNGEISLEF